MKSLNRKIDTFCYNHPKFGISNLMLYIIIGNAVFYIFSIMDRTGTFLNYFYFDFSSILHGQVWRLITFIFIPQDSRIIYEAISLYFYYFIGSTLERQWGPGKFTIFYLSAMLWTVLYGIIFSLLGYGIYGTFLGGEFINLSMFFIFALTYPDMRVLLFFIIPIKMKWLAIVDAIFFAFNIFALPFPIDLVPLLAIANVFIFCWEYISAPFTKKRIKERKNIINFQNAARAAEHKFSEQQYRHKCCICGKTDADYPNMQFRYCSRCIGYHCFCEDHINNHVHFTE